MPHFQVVLGGEWEHNGGSYGLPVAAIPSKNIPQVVTRLTRAIRRRTATSGETFKDFVKRIGKVELKKLLEDLTQAARRSDDRSFFSDWGDPREYTLGDMGVGECAGEVVSAVEFDLAAAEREVFEAQMALESGQIEQGREDRVSRDGARGQGAGEDRASRTFRTTRTQIVAEFRTRYLRHAEILRSVRRRKIRASTFSTRTQKADQALHRGFQRAI